MTIHLWVIKARLRRLMTERLAMWLAWHVIPKPVRIWVVVRAFADATTTPPGDRLTPNEVGYDLVMQAMR